MFRAFFSDPHFGHANIIEQCNRPFSSVEDMEATMVANYNKLVRPGDVVLWLGDCIMKGSQDKRRELVGSMNGHKVLLLGNHDLPAPAMARLGFDLVLKEAVLNIDGITCRVSHYPDWSPSVVHGVVGGKDKYRDRRPQMGPGEVLIHGHTHSASKISTPYSVHVGVDAWNYGPAPFEEVAELVWDRRVKLRRTP